MSKNNKVILEQLVKQELENYGESLSHNDFFEIFAADQILKDFEMSSEEIASGITGASHDGGIDSFYLFVNGDYIREAEQVKEKYKKNVDIEVAIIQSKYQDSFSEDAILKISRVCKSLFDFEFIRENFEGRYNDAVLSR
ncbi:MAG: hypothetical protein JXX29_14990 [Deltaproteobacteria bacterium]|nr:hypothetical protein [Deltaproteobacteria bacterium]